MKFTCSVVIAKNRDDVVHLFDNPDNLQHWQDGFISLKHSSGTPGKAGAQSTIRYDIRGKKMDMLETVTKRNPPEEFHGTYEGDFGKNTMHNYFDVLGPESTRWRSELEYLEMNGFIMKTMAFLMPSIFKKQTQKWMDQFKAFAEKS